MRRSVPLSVRYAAVAATATLVLSGCSVFGGGAVPQEELEKDVAAELNEQSGQDNEATCEGDLEAEEDATQRCTWTSDEGDEVPVEVTATKVDGEDVEYSIDPQPRSPVPADAVARSEVEKDVATELNKQSGEDNEASCEGDLKAEQGATVQCTWGKDGGSGIPVEVTVTASQGGDVDYDIEPQQPLTGGSVAQPVLEREVRRLMEEQTQESFPVTCKGGLDGKIGATQRCVWNASDGSTLGIDVELTGYSNGTANFHIQADNKATPAPRN